MKENQKFEEAVYKYSMFYLVNLYSSKADLLTKLEEEEKQDGESPQDQPKSIFSSWLKKEDTLAKDNSNATSTDNNSPEDEKLEGELQQNPPESIFSSWLKKEDTDIKDNSNASKNEKEKQQESIFSSWLNKEKKEANNDSSATSLSAGI